MPRSRGALVGLAVLAALRLAGPGSGAGPSLRNGRIAYDHLGASVNRFQIYAVTSAGTQRRQLTRSRTYSSFAPSYSPGGRTIVYVRSFKQSDLWVMNAAGTRHRSLTRTKTIRETDPAWSPDGKQIVFAVESPAAQRGIWVVGVDGHGRRRLTNGVDAFPSWSPDGSEIAFDRYDHSTQLSSIYIVPAGGGTPTNLSSDPGASDLEPAWSPDGRRILFASDRPDRLQLDLWVMRADGSDVVRITNTPSRDERDGVWSPDGRRIVYSGQGSNHGSSSSQIYVSNANGTHRRVLSHACGECAIGNDQPTWQPLPR